MIIKNWRRVLLRAASMWCVYLVGFIAFRARKFYLISEFIY